jgi:succinate dehydrogenase / fumarate reductase flavoprotein subunit
VFGKRAGEYAAKFAKENPPAAPDSVQIEEVARACLAPFERDAKEGPYAIQHELQEMMQDLVGIVRTESEMKQALEGLKKLAAQAAEVGASGNREYNPGWHTALDLDNLLTVSEAITPAAIDRKESRGGHFRDDYPEKNAEYSKFNIVISKGNNGEMTVRRVELTPMRDDLKQVIEENK